VKGFQFQNLAMGRVHARHGIEVVVDEIGAIGDVEVEEESG
jgi:hypothetical protein